MGAFEVCVDVDEGRERLWPNIEGGGSGDGALVSLEALFTLVNRSNSPSLMGTEAGRRIGSTGDALYSRGANAEAVMEDVETGGSLRTSLVKSVLLRVMVAGEDGDEYAKGCRSDVGERWGVVCEVWSVYEVKGEVQGSV